jgi:hypothetical protein
MVVSRTPLLVFLHFGGAACGDKGALQIATLRLCGAGNGENPFDDLDTAQMVISSITRSARPFSLNHPDWDHHLQTPN